MRALGKFIVVGKAKPVGIFEVLGPASDFQPPPRWLEVFSRGVDHFSQRELDEAQRCFLEVIETREGNDGPSKLYLAQIEAARRAGPGDLPWDGTVRIMLK